MSCDKLCDVLIFFFFFENQLNVGVFKLVLLNLAEQKMLHDKVVFFLHF